MDAHSPRWRDVSPPVHQGEADGLRHIQRLLPDEPPYHAWSNLTFRGGDSSLNEVDLVVIGPGGIYLVELKGWYRVAGTDQYWERPDVRKTERNPLLGARKKAQLLKGRLSNLAGRSRVPAGWRVPFVQEAVFLHNRDLRCELDENGREDVYGLDGSRRGLPSIVADLITGLPRRRGSTLDAARSDWLAALFDKGMDLAPRARRFEAGTVEIPDTEPYAEGLGWQDYLGHEQRSDRLRRRVRIFRVTRGASAEERRTVSRAAEREMHLMQGIVHPGIAKPLAIVDLDPDTALVYEHHHDQEPFDQYLARRGAALTLPDRLGLIRQIAETMQAAHDNGLFHRALSPASIHVRRPGSTPELVITNWQTGGREAVSVLAPLTLMAGTRHLEHLVGDEDGLYQAPEAGQPDSSGPLADVFSLGALAYTIVTGRPPAASRPELREVLNQRGGLDPGPASGPAEEALAMLVHDATAPAVSHRLAGPGQFLARLADVERLADGAPVDPLDAERGDVLDGLFRVEARLDKGSTARALLVGRVDEPSAEPVVLKVALDHDKDPWLDAEAGALGRLDDWRIVKLLPGPPFVGHRRTLVLENCGEHTLLDRLRQDRLHLDQVRRFGGDLLEIAAHLEARRVRHRDIKPDNLGIRVHPGDGRPHLVLYDFSMAQVPDTHLTAGTRPYLDPFLGTGDRRAYDKHAEWFAVAVTLYEIATGEQPRWGDGSDPRVIGDEVTVEVALLDPVVRQPLAAFFRRALTRQAASRYSTVAEMRRAWEKAFETPTTVRPSAAEPVHLEPPTQARKPPASAPPGSVASAPPKPSVAPSPKPPVASTSRPPVAPSSRPPVASSSKPTASAPPKSSAFTSDKSPGLPPPRPAPSNPPEFPSSSLSRLNPLNPEKSAVVPSVEPSATTPTRSPAPASVRSSAPATAPATPTPAKAAAGPATPTPAKAAAGPATSASAGAAKAAAPAGAGPGGAAGRGLQKPTPAELFLLHEALLKALGETDPLPMIKAVEVMKAAVPRMSSTNWVGRRKPRKFVKEFFPDFVHLTDPSGGALCRPVPAKKAPAKAAPADAPTVMAAANTAPAKAVPAKAVPAKALPAKAVPAKTAPARSAPAKTAPATVASAKASPVPKQKAAPVQPPTRYLTADEIELVRAELLLAVARKNPFPLSRLPELVRKAAPWILQDWAGYKRPGRFMEHVFPEFAWVSGPAGGGYRPPAGWSPPPRPRPAPEESGPAETGTTRFGESVRRFTSQIRRILE